jgi:hypothetical protein
MLLVLDEVLAKHLTKGLQNEWPVIHNMNKLCAPAEATSKARLTCSYPLISAKSVAAKGRDRSSGGV